MTLVELCYPTDYKIFLTHVYLYFRSCSSAPEDGQNMTEKCDLRY